MTTITDRAASGTYTFIATLSRWDSAKGQRRNRAYRLHSDRFDTAYRMATLLLEGAQDADPAREYSIVAVLMDGYGGIEVEQGWLTTAEYFEATREATPADRTGE